MRNDSHPSSSLGGGLGDGRFGHTAPKQNLESHRVSLHCPWHRAAPLSTGLSTRPLRLWGGLGCSLRALPDTEQVFWAKHSWAHVHLCPAPYPPERHPGRREQGVPQLPRSVQALPIRLTLCRLSWGQQAGLQGPNHRFPGMVFLPLEDAGVRLSGVGSRTGQGLLAWELGSIGLRLRTPLGPWE